MKKIALLLGCLLLSAWAQAENLEQGSQFSQGIALLENKQFEQAEKIFSQLVDKSPEQIIYLNNLAVALMAQGKTDQALETLNSAISSDQVYSISQKNLSQIYAFMASQAYAKALDKNETTQLPELQPIKSDPEEIAQLARNNDQTETTEDTDLVHPVVESGKTVSDVNTGLVAPENPEPEQPAVENEAAASQIETQLKDKLEAWASSWMRGEVDTYLSFYSSSFIPADKLSYQDWESQRRYRLRHSNQVQVSYNQVEIYFDSELKSAIVEFVQRYSAGNYSDVVKKQLYWQFHDNNWLITREQVTEKI